MSTSLAATVRANVRAELARRGMKQSDLAEPLGINASAVSHRLGGRTPFTIDELDVIAAVLGVPAASLLEVH